MDECIHMVVCVIARLLPSLLFLLPYIGDRG
jgi:hypothetical protein